MIGLGSDNNNKTNPVRNWGDLGRIFQKGEEDLTSLGGLEVSLVGLEVKKKSKIGGGGVNWKSAA